MGGAEVENVLTQPGHFCAFNVVCTFFGGKQDKKRPDNRKLLSLPQSKGDMNQAYQNLYAFIIVHE